MALLLAFDTATPHLAVVLGRDEVVLAQRVVMSGRATHAERLNVVIQEVMDEAGIPLSALDGVAVGIGPGSYTGLRIGLSAAKGLCFALDKPLIGMGTLEILCHQLCASGVELRPGDRLQPMVDARRMEVFTQPFTVAIDPQAASAPAILDEAWCAALGDRRTVVFGDGADKAAALWDAHPITRHVPGIVPSIEGLVRCAARYFREGRISDLAYLVPDYGKEANVAQPKKSRT